MKNKENLVLLDKITGNRTGRILTSLTVLIILGHFFYAWTMNGLDTAFIYFLSNGLLFLIYSVLAWFIISLADLFIYWGKRNLLKEKIKSGRFPGYHDTIAIIIGTLRLVMVGWGSFSFSNFIQLI
jgi:purine-cytosine permease-like protein